MFIVIEGIDGAGCETQAKNLTRKLTKLTKYKIDLIKYPDYDRNVGKLIKEFLYQNKDLTAEQQFLLYTLQFIMDKQMIQEKRRSSNHQPPTTNRQPPILIADRYFTTTLCYQTLEGIDLNWALDYAKNFKIEKPDVVFYLDVDPEIAIKRKFGEAKEKNRREKDFEFIRKTYKQYDYLVKNQVWCKWVRIDGNKGVDEITENIYNYLINLLRV